MIVLHRRVQTLPALIENIMLIEIVTIAKKIVLVEASLIVVHVLGLRYNKILNETVKSHQSAVADMAVTEALRDQTTIDGENANVSLGKILSVKVYLKRETINIFYANQASKIVFISCFSMYNSDFIRKKSNQSHNIFH